MFNDISSPLALLKTRRSGKPRDMIAPGPNAAEMETILDAAMRVPDHGKLAPWRFVEVLPGQRGALADVLTKAYRAERPDAGRIELDSMAQFAAQAPALVVVLSSPIQGSKIPVWEQQLSVGAACMNLLTATHALGYVGSWLTGWPAYSTAVRDAFGGENDRIAGFIFIGSPGRELEERPRPDRQAVSQIWQGSEKG